MSVRGPWIPNCGTTFKMDEVAIIIKQNDWKMTVEEIKRENR